MSEDEAEGRLTAHRDILTKVLFLLAKDEEKRAVLYEWLDERRRVKDHQEDPGAVIQEGFAEQQARAEEFRIISDNLRRLVDVYGRDSTRSSGS
ncbi:hypothetical protein ACFFVJ_02080 [Roseibium salinum]